MVALGKLDFSNSVEIPATEGGRGRPILSGFILKNYWDLLEAEFKPKGNKLLSVIELWNRSKQGSRTLNEWLTYVYNLVELCDYFDSKDRIIRDVLIIGCNSDMAKDTIMTGHDPNDSSMENDTKRLSITDEDFIDNCEYLNEDIELDHTMGPEDDLNVVQLNTRGLISKQNSLTLETTPKNPNKKVDIYILYETWLNENNSFRVNVPNYSFVGKSRTNKKGGGVGILVHNSLAFSEKKEVQSPPNCDLESIFIEIKTRQRSLIVGIMYRPPHTKEKQFLDDYIRLL